MRTGRPVDEHTQYRMIIHNNGGHRYAATKTYTIGEDGKKSFSCGTLTSNAHINLGPLLVGTLIYVACGIPTSNAHTNA